MQMILYRRVSNVHLAGLLYFYKNDFLTTLQIILSFYSQVPNVKDSNDAIFYKSLCAYGLHSKFSAFFEFCEWLFKSQRENYTYQRSSDINKEYLE
jgi:hypothetical protein